MGLRPLSCLLGLAVVIGGGGVSCRSSEVAFELQLPSSVAGSVQWFEIGAFADTSCAALAPMLGGGIPEGSTRRIAFSREEVPTPQIGELPRKSYAFGAVARDERCAIIAAGCTEADVGDTEKVIVRMTETDPTGACTLGTSCQGARCVPVNDNLDPSVGAGCSLELVGAGPVANSLGGNGTLTSAPAVAATPKGFVIAYREIDPNGAGGRLTLLPVDVGGGAGEPIRPALPDRCPDSDEYDGVGLVVRGQDGMLALARPGCGTEPALELLNFRVDPLEIGKFFVSQAPPGTVRLRISPSNVVGARGVDSDVLAFVDGDVGRVATMHPTPPTAGGIGAPSGSFGGTSGITGAWAAASDRVLALLAVGTGSVGPPPDGGLPDGGDSTESTLRLVMVPVATPLDQFVAAVDQPVAPIVFPGKWGALAAKGTRVIVLSDGGGPGRSVTFRSFDLGRNEPADTSGFGIDGAGTITTGAVAMAADRVYFAVLREGGIALSVFGNASTIPSPLRSVLFSREPRIPSVSGVRDGSVAVAATDTRVIVAWTNAKVLGPNDYTGGYAVFACTQ